MCGVLKIKEMWLCLDKFICDNLFNNTDLAKCPDNKQAAVMRSAVMRSAVMWLATGCPTSRNVVSILWVFHMRHEAFKQFPRRCKKQRIRPKNLCRSSAPLHQAVSTNYINGVKALVDNECACVNARSAHGELAPTAARRKRMPWNGTAFSVVSCWACDVTVEVSTGDLHICKL